ncbi:MAG: sensor histidine kinase [Chloroflexota bacterium]
MMLWLLLGLAAAGIALLVMLAVATARQYRQRPRLQAQVRLLQQQVDDANEASAFVESINQSFIHQAPTAMLLVDENSKLTFANPAAERRFHLSSLHTGLPLIQVVRDHDLDQLVRRVLHGVATADAIEIRPPGQDLVLRASAQRIGGQAPRGVAIVVEDLTELHRLEAVRREFVANVSHELRTPLATVKAMVETLQLDGLADTPRALRYLVDINREMDHLATLVHDLLDLSRIESGRMELQPRCIDLRRLVEETVDKLGPRRGEGGLAISCHSSAETVLVLADPTRTRQIVRNLVDNAMKFTPPGGTVAVSIDTAEGQAQVTVRDSGVGIPEEDQPRIFERFYKVDKGRARQDNPGTGLGLAIVKHLVGAMDGDVGVQSTLGQGSSFFFSLPLVSGRVETPEPREEVVA